METDKIYCGSAKIVTTKYGELTKVSFSKDDINKMVSYMKASNCDWINLVIKAKKEPQPNKPTHYLEVDTYKPQPKEQSYDPKKDYQYSNVIDDKGDLPF